jgi:hypothetical protein
MADDPADVFVRRRQAAQIDVEGGGLQRLSRSATGPMEAPMVGLASWEGCGGSCRMGGDFVL